jgi:hypothetical protein
MAEPAETKSFLHADRCIGQLLDALNKKGLCGCCVARALLYHGAFLYEGTMGSIEAAEELETMAAHLRGNNKPAPDHGNTQH